MTGLVAAAVRLVCGTSVRWHCDPSADVQRIYFANHASHFDAVVIWSVLPPSRRRLVRPVAGRDYWDRGRVRRLLAGRVFNAVLIDRHSQPGSERARAATERMAAAMGGRGSLIVFPEGTRSVDGTVGPFKSGLYHLTQAKPDAELVPVYLENLNRLLPKGEVLPVPVLSRVVCGSPLDRCPGEDKAAFLARARMAVLQLRSVP